jgi:hypothetical protein
VELKLVNLFCKLELKVLQNGEESSNTGLYMLKHKLAIFEEKIEHNFHNMHSIIWR